MKTLWKYLRPHKKLVFLALLLAGMAQLLALIDPVIFGKATRSAVSTIVTREKVKFKFDHINIIKSQHAAFHFENKNGGDLYIYPAFVIATTNKKQLAFIDIKEFEIGFYDQRFVEQQRIPSDTKIIDKTWAKVNKNGSPDKRFKGNYQIPIVKYGEFVIKSNSGLNESYAFSNYEKARDFAASFKKYQDCI